MWKFDIDPAALDIPAEKIDLVKLQSQVASFVKALYSRNGTRELAQLPPLDHTNWPELPEVVWKGLFLDYRSLVAPTTEAPDAYHFAVFALVLGATLGRRISVYHAVPLYPNFFVALVGPTGISRKDTAWSRGRTILQRLHADEDPDDANPAFQIIPGVGSAEGLLDALSGEDKVVVLNEAELLTLLAKARQEGLGNLIPKLTTLYDSPEVETLKTRNNAVLCRRPFLSIISGTTTAWLHKALSARDIYGGFANRFIYVLGKPKDPMPTPPAMDDVKLDKLLTDINDVRKWVVDKGGRPFTPSEEAKDIFAAYYAAFHQRCVTDSIISALIPRMQSHAWKLALLYAALNYETTIEYDHMLAGITAANFFEASARAVFLNFPGTLDLNEKERRLVSLLEKADGPVARRDVYRRLNWSAKELNEATTNLIRVGLLKSSLVPATSGPPIDCLESTERPI